MKRHKYSPSISSELCVKITKKTLNHFLKILNFLITIFISYEMFQKKRFNKNKNVDFKKINKERKKK